MQLQGKQIFVVEDNLQLRILYQVVLTRHGATITFDRWGRSTLFHLSGMSRVDAIVLDLMLTDGISGFDIFEQIRALPQFTSTPIVAMSAMEPALALPQARAKGLNGFIAKPIDVQRFPQQIASLIAGEPVWHVGQHTLS